MVATPEIQASEVHALAAINFPSPELQVSEVHGLVTLKVPIDIQVSEVHGLVAALGRIKQPNLRAWTFTLDGHDFYVLRLGDFETLIYDTNSQQWSLWNSADLPFWRPSTGVNWIGGEDFGTTYGSNIITADDTFGVLWALDPDYPYDDHTDGVSNANRFTRTVTGQLPLRGRDKFPVYDVYVMGDIGHPAVTGDTVTLEYSDDAGNTYVNAGSVALETGEYKTDLAWRSLGQATAPGRLFRVNDTGALARIDDMQVNVTMGD